MAALINVTLPVFNEEIELRPSVERLVKVLTSEAGYRWEVVIADNGSVDRTPEIAAALER